MRILERRREKIWLEIRSVLSGDFEMSELINGELSDSSSFCYEKSEIMTTWLGGGFLYPNVA